MKRFVVSFIAVLCCMVMNAEITFEVDGIKYCMTSSNTVKVVANNYSEKVIIPTTVTSASGTKYDVTGIGDHAFEFCHDLTSITIPNSVMSIESSAFHDCSGLTSITIPNSVMSIGDYAFDGCSGLASITIPSSVTSIGNNTFDGCSGLTSITIPNSVTSIGSYAFRGCSGLTSITISSGVESIGDYAFLGCSGLKSITIPSSVTTIHNAAFKNCINLESLVVLPATPPSVGEEAFYNVSPDIPIYVNDVNEYEKNESWKGFTNFKGFNDYKEAAISEINAAMKDVTLTDADEGAISAYMTQINSASDFAAAIAAKEAALAVLKLPKAKYAALAEIQKEMDGETGSAYLNGLITEYVNAINAATNESTISSNKESAISKIESVITTYKTIKTEGKSAALGEMGEEKTNCPAVKVMKGDKVVILYAPDKVEMIKVSENK